MPALILISEMFDSSCPRLSRASTPQIARLIADLEHRIGVRLLDRGPQGIEPTIFGQAFLKRGLAAFDELKQGIRDIEFLTDPTVGELRIGCDESLSAATLP